MPGFGSEWRGRLDPDGRFAVWPNRRTKSYATKDNQEEVYRQAQCDLQRMSVYRTEDTGDRVPDWTRLAMLGLRSEVPPEGESGEPALGSSKLINSEKKRAKRGTTGITAHGKRLLRNSVGLLEFRYGKDRMSFFTGTLPPLSAGDEKRLVENWSKGLENFKKKIQYHLRAKGLCAEVAGCVEIQEKRRERTGELGWHVHLVFVGRRAKRGWILSPAKVKKLWRQTWQCYLQGRYNWDASTQIARIVRSAASYLAKYLSKGSRSGRSIATTTEQIKQPSAWYVCTRLLREWVKLGTIESDDMGAFLKDLIVSNSEAILFWSKVEVEVNDGRSVAVCLFGTSDYKCFAVPPPNTVDFPR